MRFDEGLPCRSLFHFPDYLISYMQTNYIRKTVNLLFILWIFALSSGFAKEYVIGGKNNWNDIEYKKNVQKGTGRFGYPCMELETNQFESDGFTDLLVNFEGNTVQEVTGNYTVSKNDFFIRKEAKLGRQAGLSRNRGIGLHLTGEPESLFGRHGPAGSFCIEYWICPSIVENGEILLNWSSSIGRAGNVDYQMIRVNIYQNKIHCLFSNIFEGYTQNHGDVVLEGITNLVPGKWTHHIISFNEENGRLEYRINGVLEAIKTMTDSGSEEGTVYPAVLGVKADIEFCPEYSGYADDFKISTVPYDFYSEKIAESAGYLHRMLYKTEGGYFRTSPVMFKAGTIINSVRSEMSVPSQTEVLFYIRSGDNRYGWDENFPEWKQIKNGEQLSDVSGRYVQIAVELLPDGSGLTTPKVTDLVIDYTELPAPLPPFKVSAIKGNGSVTLEWSASLEETAGGYYIYYGTKSGEYLGRQAVEGLSPINAGNTTRYTLTGLKNGTIYYFAISTYSRLDSRITGDLSQEVFARPSERY